MFLNELLEAVLIEFQIIGHVSIQSLVHDLAVFTYQQTQLVLGLVEVELGLIDSN